MRRLLYLLILVLFVGVSASCISASTDCERWFAAYRQELAHARSVQRIAAAKRRAKLYAQRKLAGYVAPKPKPKLVRVGDPRMTRRQTLRHFELACGVLPEDQANAPNIAEETPAPFIEHPLTDSIDILPAALGDMITQNTFPPAPYTDQVSPNYPSSGGPSPFTPPYTGGVTPPNKGGTTTPPPTNPPPTNPPPTNPPPTNPPPTNPPPTNPPPTNPPPTNPPPANPPPDNPPPDNPPPPYNPPPDNPPPDNPPPDNPPPAVPEPSSYILVLTGLAGAAGAIRSRFKS